MAAAVSYLCCFASPFPLVTLSVSFPLPAVVLKSLVLRVNRIERGDNCETDRNF